jgi:hypothetical protein
VLAAVTEVIKVRGGSESETEYFAALVRVKNTLFVYFIGRITGVRSMSTLSVHIISQNHWCVLYIYIFVYFILAVNS